MRHRPHCLVAATCSVRTLSCLSHAPTPLPPRSAPMSRAMTHAPLSCISWSLQVHSLSLGNLLQDPLTAAHRSDGRSWSAIGVSLQLGEGPAALGLLLVLGMRALPTCGCRRGRRVLLLVGCHCPASEFLPRAASELGGLVLLVWHTGLVQLACATGRTGQVECHCSKLHSVCCTWRTHVGVPMQSIADQELDWATVALEVSVECRSVSCSEARGMAGTGRQNCIFSGRAVRLNSLTSRKKKGSKSKYLPAKSDRKTDTVERNAPQSRSTTDLELARVPRPTSYLHRYRPARATDRVTRGARAHSCRSHCALRRGERGGATWPLPLLRRRRGRGTAGHSPLR